MITTISKDIINEAIKNTDGNNQRIFERKQKYHTGSIEQKYLAIFLANGTIWKEKRVYCNSGYGSFYIDENFKIIVPENSKISDDKINTLIKFALTHEFIY